MKCRTSWCSRSGRRLHRCSNVKFTFRKFLGSRMGVHTSSPIYQKTKCLNVYEDASLEHKQYDLIDPTALGVTIHPRDFTTLDVEVSGATSNRARRRRSYTLLPRPKFILINYGSIKALLVKNDKIVIFGADTSKMVEDWAYKLKDRIPYFQECVESGVSVSFELGVLEETLKEACDMFDRRLRL